MRLDGRLVVAAVAFAFGPGAPLVGAQSLARQDLPVFGTGVQVVAVPVFVTDDGGKAVPGLTAADFEIEDRGREVAIVAFEAIDAESPLPPAADAGPLVQAAARRQFLFLFDLTFSTPVGIMRARDAAIEMVDTVFAPGDLAAVATFGRAGLRLLVGFTADREQLAGAILDLGLTETERERDPLRLAWEMGIEVARTGTSDGLSRMDNWLRDQHVILNRSDRDQYGQRVDDFVVSLAELGRLLDSVQGRKQVVLLSSGFDQSVLLGDQGLQRADSAQAVTRGRLWEVPTEAHFGDADARQRLRRLYDVLAASDTVVHSVDVSGMATGGGAVDTPRDTRPAGGRESLADLALNTGGYFVQNANDLVGGLHELLDATRHYYVVAFEPYDGPEGKKSEPRKLEVEVRGRDLDVSHRKSYVLPDSEKVADALSSQLQAAETIAKGLTGGPIALRAVAVPYRAEDERLLLPVVLEIEGETLLHGRNSGPLGLEVFGYAMDPQGRIYDVLAARPTLDLDRAADRLRSKGLQVLTTFAVPDGPADLRFLVREVDGPRAGALRIAANVPAFEGGALTLSPPLFVDDPRARVVFPAASRANPGLDIPFRVGDVAFTPDAGRTFPRGGRREVCVMAWVGKGEAPSWDVSAELVGPAGPVKMTMDDAPRRVADTDGFERIVLSLGPGSAPPGKDLLRVRFQDPRSAKVTLTETAVAVR
jgi:VWFA-related protein